MQESDYSSGIDSEPTPGGAEALAVTALAVSVVTLAALWVVAGLLWPALPERIPVHFDLRGVPDRIVQRTLLSWLALPLTATGMTVFLLGLTFVIRPLARGEAKWLNIPRKKEFLKLPPEARARTLRLMDLLLWGTPAPMNLIFTYVVRGTYAVATKRSATLSPVPIILGTAAVLVWTVLCIVALRRAIIDEAAKLPSTKGGGR